MRAKKLFEASLVGDVQLVQEMKRVRAGKGCDAELPGNVAGANGEEEIVEKFKEVYSQLYNSSGSASEVTIIKDRIKNMINEGSIMEVAKITGENVKEAVGLMKRGKTDVTGGYSSDAILNGPDILFTTIAAAFKSWCIHGKVTTSLLSCGFLPLLKLH